MSEPEVPTPSDPEPEPTPTEEPATQPAETPEQLITTTMTKDFLNRALFNPVPGTSNATDFLGRAVVTGNKDYLNRGLVA
jgi:hypothetical protein